MCPWQKRQTIDQVYPHKLILYLVVKPSLKANQRMKECLGMAKGNQTILYQSTFGNFTLNWFQVSKQEYFPY
jgi:hypothetical protein